VSAGRIARELWWTSQEFSQPASSSSSPWLSKLTFALGMNNRPTDGRGSEMSHPINMINQSRIFN
jgi:hypothetical protein